MKLRVVSSKKEINELSRNEQVVHLAFRASNMDVMGLVQSCPRLRAVQIPPSYHETMSKAAQQFLEIQGIELLKGDVWGHRKDIDEYYTVSDKVIRRISNLMSEGNSVDETIKRVQRETKLSEDLIRYILKEQVLA
jgi:maleate cis-trans isomerase